MVSRSRASYHYFHIPVSESACARIRTESLGGWEGHWGEKGGKVMHLQVSANEENSLTL